MGFQEANKILLGDNDQGRIFENGSRGGSGGVVQKGHFAKKTTTVEK